MTSIYDSAFWEVCDKCSYGNSQMTIRREMFQRKYGQWQPEYTFCAKVGGEHWMCGWCNDPIELSNKKRSKSRSEKRNTGRAYRRIMKCQKDNRLLKIIRSHYVPHAGYISADFDGNTLHGTPAYIKYLAHSTKQRFLKKKTSKKIRKIKDVPNRNGYKKYQEYWWSIY